MSGGTYQVAYCDTASWNTNVNSFLVKPNIYVRTYPATDPTCAGEPMFSYHISDECMATSARTSTRELCVSTLEPWAQYGPGLLVTGSTLLANCRGPPSNVDTWTFSPINKCITGQVGGPFVITACNNLAGRSFYTVAYYNNEQCQGAATSVSTMPLHECGLDLNGQFRGMTCIN